MTRMRNVFASWLIRLAFKVKSKDVSYVKLARFTWLYSIPEMPEYKVLGNALRTEDDNS